MTAEPKSFSRLAVRYFDDRVLLIDMHGRPSEPVLDFTFAEWEAFLGGLKSGLPFRQSVFKAHSWCDLPCDHRYVYKHAPNRQGLRRATWRSSKPTVRSSRPTRSRSLAIGHRHLSASPRRHGSSPAHHSHRRCPAGCPVGDR
jgi:hypothetical protein